MNTHERLTRSVGVFASAVVLSLLVAACGPSSPPADGTDPGASTALEPEVSAIIGATGSSGETQLTGLGYTASGGRPDEGGVITFWRRASDDRCLMVRTVDGRYESITQAAVADCESAAAAMGSVAEADAGGFRTVCGVMVDGKPVTYVCSVVGGDQHATPATLRFPDLVMTLHWLDDKRVRVEMDGVNPIEGTWSDSEGETSIVTSDRTWFYTSNRDAAALALNALGQ